MLIKYRFEFDDKKVTEYSIDTICGYLDNPADNNEQHWIKLDYYQCEICPLNQREYKVCPAAVILSFLIKDFDNISSFQPVKVTVTDSERDYYKECDVQTALNSLLGLLLSTSNCPVLSQLKYMAQTHLPFASFEDSIIRTLGHYLIKQLILQREGLETDFQLEKFEQLYNNLAIVNTNLQKRIQSNCKTDANINAIQAFFALSSLIKFSLNDNLNDIKSIFI